MTPAPPIPSLSTPLLPSEVAVNRIVNTGHKAGHSSRAVATRLLQLTAAGLLASTLAPVQTGLYTGGGGKGYSRC